MGAPSRTTGIVAAAALLLHVCAAPQTHSPDAALAPHAPTLAAPAMPRLSLPYALPLPGGARPLPPMARPLLPASPMHPGIAADLFTPPWIFVILATTLAWNQAPLFSGV